MRDLDVEFSARLPPVIVATRGASPPATAARVQWRLLFRSGKNCVMRCVSAAMVCEPPKGVVHQPHAAFARFAVGVKKAEASSSRSS